MTPPSDLETAPSPNLSLLDEQTDEQSRKAYLDELPNDVEMSLFDHLDELRQRIFYALIAVLVGVIACFTEVRRIVELLEIPAQGAKFLQLSPGEYFFVSIKVAGYSGILIASPFILYQIIQFVLPGLTRRERRLIGPVVLGSSVLFFAGLAFAYVALVPAALNFFISYGADVVEQMWSIDRYFVLLGAAILGAVLTPSTDPFTQSLLGGAVLFLYFGGIGLVKAAGK